MVTSKMTTLFPAKGLFFSGKLRPSKVFLHVNKGRKEAIQGGGLVLIKGVHQNCLRRLDKIKRSRPHPIPTRLECLNIP